MAALVSEELQPEVLADRKPLAETAALQLRAVVVAAVVAEQGHSVPEQMVDRALVVVFRAAAAAGTVADQMVMMHLSMAAMVEIIMQERAVVSEVFRALQLLQVSMAAAQVVHTSRLA